MKENQYTEEEILDNNENSPMFEEFLQVMGEKVRLKGRISFDMTLIPPFHSDGPFMPMTNNERI